MNSYMIKTEKLDHIHLVFHFTVPLMNMSLRINHSDAKDISYS